jgi:hypothetical protein
MFETVGRVQDDEAGRRRAITAVALSALGGGAIGLGALLAALTVTGPPVAGDPFEPIAVLIEDPADEDLADLALPPPPLLARGELRPDDNPPPPDELVEEIAPLAAVVAAAVANAVAPAGDPTGSELGTDPNGDPNGRVDGVEGGEGTEVGGGEPAVPTVHVSEIRVKFLAKPARPAAARGLDLGDVSCRARVRIDEEGLPADVAIESCPLVFHDAIREAVARSRWFPHRVAGRPSRAQFTIRYVFES